VGAGGGERAHHRRLRPPRSISHDPAQPRRRDVVRLPRLSSRRSDGLSAYAAQIVTSVTGHMLGVPLFLVTSSFESTGVARTSPPSALNRENAGRMVTTSSFVTMNAALCLTNAAVGSLDAARGRTTASRARINAALRRARDAVARTTSPFGLHEAPRGRQNAEVSSKTSSIGRMNAPLRSTKASRSEEDAAVGLTKASPSRPRASVANTKGATKDANAEVAAMTSAFVRVTAAFVEMNAEVVRARGAVHLATAPPGSMWPASSAGGARVNVPEAASTNQVPPPTAAPAQAPLCPTRARMPRCDHDATFPPLWTQSSCAEFSSARCGLCFAKQAGASASSSPLVLTGERHERPVWPV
jgi:hypothetical protein